MKLGIFLALAGLAGCTAIVVGEFGAEQDREFWIAVGICLVTVSLFGGLALVASFSPRLLLGVSTVTTVACIAAALIMLFAGHPKYAIVFGFWAVTCAGGFLILRHTAIRHHVPRAIAIPGHCPRCGGRLAPADNECPCCGLPPAAF